jgi:hypothetical protein
MKSAAVRFEKFEGPEHLVLRMGVDTQTAVIDEGCGMEFFLLTNWSVVEWAPNGPYILSSWVKGSTNMVANLHKTLQGPFKLFYFSASLRNIEVIS